ncbi:hypothetical protein [Mycolicibacterium anyangense]|uniref:hypothetical protein n=1 Tax=Mycolicibacterium anyangense TaxID=1431246 RepID=UPI0013D1B289|nr:hypothetical protein [Mycolicibacterium anyangense]
MSTWFSRVAERLAALLDPSVGPWNPTSREWGDVDADLRRQHADLDAIRVRFSDHR